MTNIRISIIACLLLAILTGCRPSNPESENVVSSPSAVQNNDESGFETAEQGGAAARTNDTEQAINELDIHARDNSPVDASIIGVSLSNVGNSEKQMIGASTIHFQPADVVYAEVKTQGHAKAYTLYAKWIASDESVLADYGVQVTQPGLQRTIISLSKPDGWPSGLNRIELAINGKAERTVTFDVP